MELLLKFLVAVFNQWVPLLTGGVLLAAVSLWQWWWDQSVPGFVYRVLIVATLAWATFLAWRAEYEARMLALEATDKGKPKLAAQIDQVMVSLISEGPRGEGGNPKTVVFLNTSVRNQGSVPSIAEKYTLTIRCGDGTAEDISSVFISEITLNDDHGEVATFTADQLLFEKTTAHPIEPGGFARGWLIFFAPPNLSVAALNSAGAAYELQFLDVLGTRLEAKTSLTDTQKGPPRYYPGVTNPFKRRPSFGDS